MNKRYKVILNFSKQQFALSIGVILIIFLSLYNLQYGVTHYELPEIFSALWHRNENAIIFITLFKIRLPMILMAIMAGAGMAIAGLLLQKVTQNPLACPSLTGMEYGTALCVILVYLFLPNANRLHVLCIALLGGVFNFILIQCLIKKMGVSLIGITLIGIAFDALYFSVIQAILIAFPMQAQAMLYNLNGSIQGITVADIQLTFIFFSVLLTITLLFSRRLNLLDLDDNQAASLGFNIFKYRFIMLALSLLFTVVMTSMIGPLLFFSLIVPHVVKPFSGNKNSIVFCAVFGAVLLLFAQLLTQLITPQTPPPVGIISLLIAAPLLIYITRQYFYANS